MMRRFCPLALSLVLFALGVVAAFVATVTWGGALNSTVVYNYLNGLGTLLLGIGTLGGVFFLPGHIQALRESAGAREKEALRSEHQRRMMFELAEKTMDLSHYLEGALRQIRSPARSGREAERAVEEYPVNLDELAHNARYGLIALMRMKPHWDRYIEMRQLKPKAAALLGLEGPLTVIENAWHRVRASAETLAINPKHAQYDSDLSGQLMAYIWANGGSQGDQLGEQVNGAVKEIEAVCVPILKGELKG